MSTNFHAGQKVVCVDADLRSAHDYRLSSARTGLVEGAVYTIQNVWFDPKTRFRGKVGALVVSLVGVEPDPSWVNFKGFRASRFRPVVTKKTDISIFKAMLNHAPKQIPLDVERSSSPLR